MFQMHFTRFFDRRLLVPGCHFLQSFNLAMSKHKLGVKLDSQVCLVIVKFTCGRGVTLAI